MQNEKRNGSDPFGSDGIAAAQLKVYAANGDWLVIEYARQEVPLGDGATDRVAIVNGMGGAIERITVGGETLSYAQFVGRYAATARSGVDALPSKRRRWQDGRTKVGAGNTAANYVGRMAA